MPFLILNQIKSKIGILYFKKANGKYNTLDKECFSYLLVLDMYIFLWKCFVRFRMRSVFSERKTAYKHVVKFKNDDGIITLWFYIFKLRAFGSKW